MGVEEMFINSVKNNPTLNNIHFDYVNKNVTFLNERGNTVKGIDIVLVNKNSVPLVEIKHRFRNEDLEKFIQKQYPMFRKYGGGALKEKIYLFIAGLCMRKR
ncbi:MAG: hypothetical protein QM536_01270 [Chitinophagaceae bacterium]|nr:hypothetical protein [Chitinophagaceae bacterium]